MPLIKPLIHLCIPQLLQPLKLWKKDFLFEAKAPHLSELLNQLEIINSEKTESKDSQGLDANLFQTIGISNASNISVAHYRSQTHENLQSKQTLLCADPVHLEVGMKEITLTESITDLTDQEAEEIIADLNKHFQQDGLKFIKSSGSQWYIELPEKETVKTTPLDKVIRKNIANQLPCSSLRNWQVIQNESQMILHMCSVNQQREMAGLATVNSLWFWGGGDVSQTALKNEFTRIVYNKGEMAEMKAKTLAAIAGCDYQPLDKEINTLINQKGNSLIILDQLFHPAVSDNLEYFQQELTQIDETIIKPLEEAWSAEKIDLLIGDCDGRILKPIKSSSWKFWKLSFMRNSATSLEDLIK